MTAIEQGCLGEQAANTVENLAFRLAERSGGRLTANHLMPYLPVSLGLIQSCLENLVAENSAVLSDATKHVVEYEFAAYKDAEEQPGMLPTRMCLACGLDLRRTKERRPFCQGCFTEFKTELTRMADVNGWPARAVYEHEILHMAAQFAGPVPAEDLAGRSRYTLRNMRGKLDTMSLEGHLEKEFDEDRQIVVYRFPKLEYPKPNYRDNMDIIRTYPASAMEEVQMRLAQILFALGIEVLVLFVLAFLRFPFFLLVLAFLVAAPATAWLIWRHRSPVDDI
jgi:hypothetical protein